MFRVSEQVPCLLGHGMMWSFRANRAFIPEELLLVQGFPVLGIADEPLWGDVFKTLPLPDGQRLAGNTIHLHVVAVILAWTIATSSAVESSGSADAKKQRRS